MSVADEVKGRLDIVDVVSDTVTLKKSGRNYTGFCPFHSNTKTPSFVVFPETQTWRCFGACADGGDIFSFVMKREGFTFKEALETLAKRAGVRLEPQGKSRTPEQDARREKLFELNAAAAAYFNNLLTTSPAGAYARQYLAKREITPETIATFQLGYALDEWEALKSHFTARGYSPEILMAAGLIVEKDDGSAGYDRFRNRLIIPIRDTRGRVIGFGARALAANQVPKYLNSPQTEIFDKSATLYGLDLARKHIRSANQVVIVEGYMDVIQAHQRGARDVVAQMGTALTEHQLKTVARLAHKIVLALDADAAGNAATLRGLSLARQSLPQKIRPASTSRGIEFEAHIGQEIYIAPLPAGKDPDDILREGLEVWQELIGQAIPSLDFYETLVLNNAELTTPQGKSAVVHELIPIYREIKDNVEKAARVQRLARKIGLDERLLLAELKTKPPRPVHRKPPPPPPPEFDSLPAPAPETEAEPATPRPVYLGLEAYCLSLILAHPATLAVANEILENHGLPALTATDFRGGENKEIFKSLQLWTALESPKIEILVNMVEDETLGRHLAALLSQWRQRPSAPDENLEQDLVQAILRLRRQNITEKIEELQRLQQEARDNRDVESDRLYTRLVEDHKQQRSILDQTRDALTLMGKRRAEARLFGQAA